jgi:hypothetical protein
MVLFVLGEMWSHRLRQQPSYEEMVFKDAVPGHVPYWYEKQSPS